jgi:signal transduction histidine kinase/DNA-binding response OmpR family regulator
VQQFLSIGNVKQALLSEKFYEKRCQYRNAENQWEAAVVTFAALGRENASVHGITMVIRSIENVFREENKRNELLTLAAQRAEAANRAKSDFLSHMSHDIRTPMNAILGMTAVAAMHIDDKARVLDALSKITTSGKHLLALINSVLDMSKIESGKISLDEEEFNLADSVQSLVSLFTVQLEKKQIAFSVNVKNVEHEQVVGDAQRLQQIFINIMGNALKFTPEGGKISLEITEQPSHSPGQCCFQFAFTDTGIGMEKEFVNKIFEPFARAADSRTVRTEGTGLGMPIALNLAQMMGGDIQVESTLGKGSRFTVTVYLKRNNLTEEDLETFSHLSVLVVDDEECICESACDILASLDMKAKYVLDGDSAVEELRQASRRKEAFSLAILDWKMPGKDGVETAREIRRVMGEQFPIIILSAYDWGEIEQEALDAGVNAFIEKPLFKSKLTRVLKEVMCADQEEESQTDYGRKPQYEGKRILLVDDQELNNEVAGELLKMLGFEVETAEDGLEAVSRLAKTPAGYFSLVFMDVHMPRMDGYQAVQKIRAMDREDLQRIPIIAMTADAFAEDIQRAHEAGMNGHIAKPIDIERVIKEIDQWIS